jgi:hypothetical protein
MRIETQFAHSLEIREILVDPVFLKISWVPLPLISHNLSCNTRANNLSNSKDIESKTDNTIIIHLQRRQPAP